MLLSFGIEPRREWIPVDHERQVNFSTAESIEAGKQRGSYQCDADYRRLAHLLASVLTDLHK
jgi:hypothetical protein